MSRYHKQIRAEIVDVYDVLNAFGVTCPATGHAIKKLLMPGLRGGKSKLQDLNEAKQSVERAIALESTANCEYCGNGKLTGLPSNACENCMNTGLKYPELESETNGPAS